MNAKRRNEVEELAAEMRGRQTAIETIMLTALAHFAAQFDKPVFLITQTMGDAEEILRQAQREAPPEDAKVAAHAWAAFQYFSNAMLAHINRHSVPRGHG